MRSDRVSPLTIHDLAEGLTWPRLLAVTRMAVHPSRIGVGFLVIALLMGFGTIFDLVRGPAQAPEPSPGEGTVVAAPTPFDGVGQFAFGASTVTDSFNEFIRGCFLLEPGRCAYACRVAFYDMPLEMIRERPASTAVLTLAALFIWTIGGGAISRMAACEAARRRAISGSEALKFASARWADLVLAILGPLLFAGALALIMAVGGFLLLRAPVVDVGGSLVYGFFIAMGFLLVIVGAGLAFAQPLTAPAVAVESCDWVDAAQRAYAYLVARPAMLLLYALLLLAQGVAAYLVVAWIASLTINWTAGLAGAWAGWEEPLRGGVRMLDFEPPARAAGLSGTEAVAARIVGVWERLVLAVLAAFVVSFYFCGSTLLYLAMRRACDRQDFEDIWMPGMIPGTTAPLQAPAEPDSNTMIDVD